MPVLEIYDELRENGAEPIIFHSGSKIELELFKNTKSIKILSGKLHRRFSLINFWEGLKLIVGFIQSFILLVYFRPRSIFSKGGFCALPVLSNANLLRIPFSLHESDSIIGLTNKLFLNRASKVFLSFPLSIYSEKLPPNAIYSGLIVRKSISNTKRKTSYNAKPQIFITGGSQGAVSMNNLIFEILPSLLKKYDIVHQVGRHSYEKAVKINETLENRDGEYYFFDFSMQKGEKAMISSDLIICRAGANTIGELAALSKAAILIPYRYASADHQLKNAKFFERANAAILLREENLNGKTLMDRIEYLLSDNKNLQTLGQNCSKAIKHDGLCEISQFLLKDMKD